MCCDTPTVINAFLVVMLWLRVHVLALQHKVSRSNRLESPFSSFALDFILISHRINCICWRAAVLYKQHNIVSKREWDFFVWVMMMRIYSHTQKQHKIKQGIFSPWLFFLYDNNTSRLDLTATRLDNKVPYRASTPLHSPLLCFENFSLFFLINILLNRLKFFLCSVNNELEEINVVATVTRCRRRP